MVKDQDRDQYPDGWQYYYDSDHDFLACFLRIRRRCLNSKDEAARASPGLAGSTSAALKNVIKNRAPERFNDHSASQTSYLPRVACRLTAPAGADTFRQSSQSRVMARTISLAALASHLLPRFFKSRRITRAS